MRILFLLAMSAFTALFAAAEDRIALIIANSDYEMSPLANPVNDARLMETALRKVGFEVHTVIDATREDMNTAFLAHGKRLTAAGPTSTGLFFYAGHGAQSEGLNYLLPVEAKPITEADIWAQGLRLEDLFRHLRFAGNQRNFVILDACRDNSLMSSTRSNAGKGLARMTETSGTLIAYATAPGHVAEDGYENSPYTSVLADLITTPGQPVETMFRRVRTRVELLTENRQRPWMESGLSGDADFCFAGCEMQEIIATDESTALAQAIESGTLYAFEQFIGKFPKSKSRGFVDSRISELTPKPLTSGAASSRSAGGKPARILSPQEEAQAMYEWQNDKQFSNSSSDLQAFLDRYPTGAHVDSVRRKIQDLQRRGD